MENLLLVINDSALNDKSLNFACYLARVTHSRLQGVLLTSAQMEVLSEDVTGKKSSAPAITAESRDAAQADILCFRRICEKEGIPYEVSSLNGDPLQEAVSASRFADLIVIGGTSSPDADDNVYLTPFVWSFLQTAECPVVIVSDQTPEVEEVILTYDGSASSIFAFRRFAHLFPCFENKRIIVVTADRFPEIKHERFIRDQLGEFYAEVTFEALHPGDFDDALFDFYRRRPNCFIVMGAAGRTKLSRLISDGKMYLNGAVTGNPVFISHY